ncbi:type II CRISPR RNA-guided endonuclease Cas9 [Prevotella jejuni]
MTQKVLGLDLGTNSIGSAVRNLDLSDDLQWQLEFFSSDIFRSSVNKESNGREYSLAAQRSAHRRSRGLNEVRRRRLWATLNLLIKHGFCPMSSESLMRWCTYDKRKGLFREYPIDDKDFNAWILLDFNGDGRPDYSSPYQLRRELVTRQFDFEQPIERYKLGRALYHIAQHRGFKSSKGETLSQQETNSKPSSTDEIPDVAGAMKASEEKLSKGLSTYMKEHNLLTVGAAFAQLEDEGVRVRNNNDYRAIRSQFQHEIETIFKFQQGLSVESELYERLISEKKNVGTIFYKRPLRSQRGKVGKCTLERSKPRCAIGHPLFEKFRAWTLINNIKVRMSVDTLDEQLPMKLRLDLYNECFLAFVRTEFKFEDIRKYLEKRLGIHFSYNDKTINYKDSTSVAGCPITARFRKMLGEEWESFRVEGQKERQAHSKNNISFHRVSYSIEDIWHFCYDAEEPEAVLAFAQETLRLERKKAEELVRIWSAMPQGYAMLSQKAIRNINKILMLGLKYSDAVILAKVPELVDVSDEELLSIAKDYYLVEAQVNYDKRINSIVNGLIAKYKSVSEEYRFADHNYEYLLDESDEKDIIRQIESSLGAKRWSLMDVDEQTDILQKVRDRYQDFFRSHERKFVESPKLGESFENYLTKKFPMVEREQWKKLYHPSQITIYRPVSVGKDRSVLRLGNPDIGAIKNPTVLRVLNTLRRRVNQLLDDGVISPDETRVVVETARELNDANRKWALDTYNRIRHDENEKIKKILEEFYPKRDGISTDDIDKARYVIDQREVDYFTGSKTYNKDIKKYKFWLEQGGQCMYTGRTINLSNLFDPNAFDIEHTIPESLSFDSSDMNLTLCDAHYNRFIKKNHIPTDMPNYDKAITIDGKEYPAITSQLQRWVERVERLNRNVEYWKGQARRAQNKDRKDQCMCEMHLWKMELEYWKKKLERFTVTEVTDGFKNSQLVDTRVITRHAVLYLKSIFPHVDVQRGDVTAKFRKILGIQSVDEKKDRSLHSHHAIDATTLTIIPVSAKRDRMLELFAKIEEINKMLSFSGSEDRTGLQQELDGLKNKLQMEVKACRIGHKVSEIGTFINDNIIVNHHIKNQALTPVRRRLRKKGYIVGGVDNPRWQTGDALRGEIHKASYYGAITQFAKDKEGKVLMKEGRPQVNPTIKFVIRRELKYKKSAADSGFASWDDLGKAIVDKELFALMKGQFPEETSFKDACEQGVYMIKKGKNGMPDIKLHHIRHVRCEAPQSGLKIKEQTYKSEKEYKRYFYAAVGDLYAMCCYTNGKIREFRIYSLYDVSCHRKSDIEDIPEFITDKKGNRLMLDYKLRTGDMILLYKDNPAELYDLDNVNLSRRLYKINRFESQSNLVLMTHHLSTSKERGRSLGKTVDYQNLPESIRSSVKSLNFLIMGENRDFVIKNGKIIFNHR